MLHKPINEISLRHLFSTNYSKNTLKIDYWGPVLNHTASIEESPDCLVVDKRKEPYKIRRCEFKYIPRTVDEFKHNGAFDIAIIWDLPGGIDKNFFSEQLREQNHCLELVVLNELIDFRRLPDYDIPKDVNLALIQRMNDFLLRREPDVIFTAYLFAKAYPNKINSEKLKDLLVDRFQRIRDMSPQGRGNVITQFTQMKPQSFIEPRYGNYYCWNDDFAPKAAIHSMERLFRENFMLDIPEHELIERIK